ncbi:MAG: hypothetical protein ACYCZM_06515 [Acidimicrobiales bacterium]
MNSTGFEILSVAHILCVVIGLGGMFFTSYFTTVARRNPGPVGAKVAEMGSSLTLQRASSFVYAIPFLGFGMVAFSHHQVQASQAWIQAGLGVWVLIVLILALAIRPNDKRIGTLIAGLPSWGVGAPVLSGDGGAAAPAPAEALELDRRFVRSLAYSGAIDVLMIAAVFVMVFKPGS